MFLFATSLIIRYQKIRGQGQVGPVPGNYCCFKCGMPGHWIKQCPLNLVRTFSFSFATLNIQFIHYLNLFFGIEQTMDIKKSTGIPRSFMVPVNGPDVPGAMMTPSGHFAVPAIDQ